MRAAFICEHRLIILGILLILPTSSAVEITSISEIPQEIHTQVGSWLLIPCRFKTNTTAHNNKIEMEWGMIPFEGGSFKSFVYVYDPKVMDYHDSRSHVFLNDLRHGNCSLVIDPVRQEDEGYFELRLGVDGNSYEPFPFLSVRVSENYAQENETDWGQSRGLLDIKKETINNFLEHPNMKKRPNFTMILISGGVFIVVAILGSCGVSMFLVQRRKKRRRDELCLAEEGGASPDSTPDLRSPSRGSARSINSQDSL